MRPETWEWIKLLTPTVGALAIVFIGAWLTLRRERKRWLNDCRKDEYKELISVLTKATIVMIKDHDPANRRHETYFRPEKMWDGEDAYMKSLEVIRDRIFIADELAKMNIYGRWTEAVKDMTVSSHYSAFESAAESIHHDLVDAARKPLSVLRAVRSASKAISAFSQSHADIG
jgi:hypothetical protein